MRAFLVLIFFQLAFAQYASPPLGEVMGNNTEAAAFLDGHYNSSFAWNGTILFHIGGYSQEQNISASVEILSLSPSIDDMSCAYGGLASIFARGHQEGHLMSLPSEGYPDFTCDRNWFDHGLMEYAWRCDFDGDNCAEFENQTYVLYDINATFTFRNVSATVPFSSTLLEVPDEVMDEMESASGAENLTVALEGNVTFAYVINDRTYSLGDCGSNYTNISQSIPVSLNASFTVGGSSKLFFLRAPVLREQWFRNNRFDLVVLSQCPLYRAEFFLNGNASSAYALRAFNITEGRYGLRAISSVLSENTANWSENSSGVASPVPLEHSSDSFRFVYEFNHSYAGLGNNNLSIEVSDSALSKSSFNETLSSRMLSFNSTHTENGSPVSMVPSRPSAGFQQDTLTHISVGLGLISLVLVLAFMNSWLLK